MILVASFGTNWETRGKMLKDFQLGRKNGKAISVWFFKFYSTFTGISSL